MVDARTMKRHVLEQYYLPFKEHRSRSGPYRLARELILSSKWLESLWDRRHLLEDIPMLLLWGDTDLMSGEYGLQLLEASFPEARAIRLQDTGNFVPQNAVKRSIVEMRGFLRSLGPWTGSQLS
jgi:hypothetical protein